MSVQNVWHILQIIAIVLSEGPMKSYCTLKPALCIFFLKITLS